MCTYTSQGTIRVRCSLRNGSLLETALFFVPENDYSIKHGDKTFAVFVPQSCDCTPQFCNKAIIRKYDRDKGNGVKITAASGCTEVISGAAVHQKKVEVWVKEKTSKTPESKKKCSEAKQCLKLKLTGITVPAK